jgi:Cys-rich repeat protein
MSWRAVLKVGLGVLSALPFIWLLQWRLHESIRPPRPEEMRFSPILTIEEQRSLSTYLRDCSDNRQCEPPLGCLVDLRNGHRYCSDSECITDMQCPEGRVCRSVDTSHGPWVRLCVTPGIRAEGEICRSTPSNKDKACAPGLICAGEGWCGRPCGKELPCPEGFFCSEKGPEPACLPTCEKRGCPAGQECIQSTEDSASTCAVVHGDDCRKTQCPRGSFCQKYLIPERPGQAWLECEQDCSALEDPTCPAGSVCYRFSCRRLCSPEQPDSCGTGYTCAQATPHPWWICRPEWYHLYPH